MHYQAADHTWVICAYGDSPYLEACIQSLKAQTVPTRILLATSTLSPYIRDTAAKYGIPVFENPERKGIGADWNFAYAQAKTKLITIAHQDDLYEPEYTANMLHMMNRSRCPILYFCDYWELKNGKKEHSGRNLKIKRAMLFPLRGPVFRNSRFIRRRILSMGSPICCPAVTYATEQAGMEQIFSTQMKVSLDWDQWEKQSRKKGAFIYNAKPQMSHRVHPGSETTKMIESNIRGTEDLEMFCRFWPEGIARRLAKWYSASEKENSV